MQYRDYDPEDDEFDDTDEEFEANHDYITAVMANSGAEELMDSLLMSANIAEARAFLRGHDKQISDWYSTLGKRIRELLNDITESSDVARPKESLENPLLYFPPALTDQTH